MADINPTSGNTIELFKLLCTAYKGEVNDIQVEIRDYMEPLI